MKKLITLGQKKPTWVALATVLLFCVSEQVFADETEFITKMKRNLLRR